MLPRHLDCAALKDVYILQSDKINMNFESRQPALAQRARHHADAGCAPMKKLGLRGQIENKQRALLLTAPRYAVRTMAMMSSLSSPNPNCQST